MPSSQTKSLVYNVSGIDFPRKEDVKVQVRGIIKKYDDDERLVEEDFDFMLALFQFHSNAAEKLALGVKEIWHALDKKYYRNQCFFILREDDTEDDISWVDCVNELSLVEKA